ncbi:exodeoxyribonuclease V subunit gamma [Denitrificimonas caeni]|uniref:exodeoxyribonuclease V subunit gamma n=1 Tax=Denitrificimonas caeni TaxID=521720 RepID=UPI0003B34A53|nr:exodeoxyribonuclease V subunit gamma [Denitrificimonas caeni]
MSESQGLQPGFIIAHSNHLEQLRDLVVQWSKINPLQPLENEIILVQSNGIAQWLKLALAADDGCGIAAGLDVGLPARFLWQTYRKVLGSETIAQSSPFDKEPLTWRLMRLLPSVIDQPVFAPLQRFLSDDADLRKCYQLAERLADLFDQYQVYRSDWLKDWAEGIDQLRQLDGQPSMSAEKAEGQTQTIAWQAELWRLLIADIGEDVMHSSRAAVHPRFVAAMKNLEHVPAGLPPRIIVFGISSLPAQMVEALAAISRFSQVMLCVHNPCQYHWADIVEDKQLLRHEYRRQGRKAGFPEVLSVEQLHQFAHPLLAAWGKQGRDYISLLDQYDELDSYQAQFKSHGQRVDIFEEGQTQTLLQQLHNDILHLRPLAETQATWPALNVEDQSLRFHIAHSAQREVEILHDQLLAHFNADPSLKPRDIIVMVPNIDSYAASIQAVFGQYARDDLRYIPFTLADQAERSSEPLLIALDHLLALPESRLTVTDIMSLLDVPALRARFAIDETHLPILQRWLTGAGVRWGLSAEHRENFSVPQGLSQNTWDFGLQRMLLGYAMGDSDAFAGIQPYDEVGGLDAALIGPFMQFLDALQALHQQLSTQHSYSDWREVFFALLEQFFLVEDDAQYLLMQRLRDGCEQWYALCEQAELTQALPLTVAREAWLSYIEADHLSQRFLAGSVNFCTLMPMRAIPFRMVCLLGMNDGDYPRVQAPLDFDLMGSDYRPGDRSRREDDRYLLLEALLSAREKLYISWVGRSVHDNSERPPSVLVAQLRDHLRSGWRMVDERPVLGALTTVHPLQPFSQHYFSGREHDAKQGSSALFTYAHEWAALHQTAVDASSLTELASFVPSSKISPQMLQRFLANPVQYFFNERLKVYFDQNELEVFEDEPFALDGLQRFSLQHELLTAGQHADSQANLTEVLQLHSEKLQRSGALPMCAFGEQARAELVEPLLSQLEDYRKFCQVWPHEEDNPRIIEASVGLIQLEGWLSGLRRPAVEESQDSEYARIELLPGKINVGKDKRWHRLLRPWVEHVLSNATGISMQTIVIAQESSIAFASLATLEAQQIVEVWLAAWQQGLDAPLSVALKTAMNFLKTQSDDKAKAIYEGGYNISGEVQNNSALARQFPTFADLQADGQFSYWAEALYGALANASITTLDREGEPS